MTITAGATATRGPMTLKDWTQLLLLGAIWGGSFFFARIAVSEIHPLALVLFRVAIAAAALQLYLAVRGPSFRFAFPYAGLFFLLALTNNVVPFSLIFAGQTELGAGVASVLNATTPFWTLILANALTTDEKLSWNKLAGIALGVAGTAVMIGPGLIAGLGGPVWAKFALIGASLSYAVALMIARRFKGVPSPVIATGQLTASTIIMIPVVLLTYGPAGLFSVSSPVWAAVLGLALLSTAFAYILYFNLVASAGATNASLVTLIVPVSAVLLGFLFLGERLAAFEIGGMALIGLGLITIDGRLFGRW
ncbi:DMT family transporter [Mesorhizobium sp. WSM4904]|uniref:DMT family transporter n=1 Tax=Mesorhizobium sp. WSM4904 TaxID=3038545 RepID=UPI002418588F|nr:DMT family transporter [Mesorhizobium sp. WSM4904]WFP60095.1 DMT family transporter [Mesorhizobium sp. WSM4904]